MAITSDDISSLMKNVDLKSLLSGGNTMNDSTGVMGGGVLGAVLIGALLPRLLGDQNGTAATQAHALTAADVQNIINGNTNTQTLGQINGEIWKAEGQVQTAIAAASATSTITNLQGQISLLSAVDSVSDAVSADIALVGTAVARGNSDILANLNTLNTNILQGTYSTALTITNDGDKTRALIQNIETAALNRQIVVAENRISELLGDRNNVASGINVTTTVNQAQAQSQAQQQQIATNQLLTQLVGVIQHNTQSTVNLGTMIGSGQTATNVNS